VHERVQPRVLLDPDADGDLTHHQPLLWPAANPRSPPGLRTHRTETEAVMRAGLKPLVNKKRQEIPGRNVSGTRTADGRLNSGIGLH